MLWKYSSTVAFISIVSVVANLTSKVVVLVLVTSVVESKEKLPVFNYYVSTYVNRKHNKIQKKHNDSSRLK